MRINLLPELIGHFEHGFDYIVYREVFDVRGFRFAIVCELSTMSTFHDQFTSSLCNERHTYNLPFLNNYRYKVPEANIAHLTPKCLLDPSVIFTNGFRIILK